MKPCKLCQATMNKGIFDYCEQCRIQWKKPRDRYYYLKKRQSDESRQGASARAQKWNEKHYDHFKTLGRERRLKLQYDTLTFYSNSDIPQCVCCGETDIKALSIDHINHDSKEDRTNRGNLYTRALRLKDKTKYQTLCFNCNWKKHLSNLRIKNKSAHKNILQRAMNQKQKQQCISVYSNQENKCQCCGNSDMEVLCLDHINNDGNIHRKEVLGINRGKLYQWAINNDFPAIFQVLCLNCNIKKQREVGK